MRKHFLIALGCVCLSCLIGCARTESKAEAPSNATSAPPANSAPSARTSDSPGGAAATAKEETQESEGQSGDTTDELHTPPKGSAERQAIMDALRAGYGRNSNVVFVVNYLMVHQGWAWADVSPVEGGQTAEGGPALLQLQNGRWKVMDLSVIPENPDDPLETTDVTPAYIKKVRKAFPKAPADIFPTVK